MNLMPLAAPIQRLIADMPPELVAALAAAWQGCADGRWSQLQARTIQVISQPTARQQALTFLAYWQSEHAQVTIESVALALLSASQMAEHYRQTQQLELVWTGPDSQVIPLRRTDQALLQLIQEAQATLHIVSFAVYQVEKISQALVTAAERGVDISIYLETPEASEGKMSLDTVRALGEAVRQRARLYVWPKEKRPLTADGKYGSLHAKIALADGRVLLLSSANLTGYALTLNMEMGILIKGGVAPRQVEEHLRRLVEENVFLEM